MLRQAHTAAKSEKFNKNLKKEEYRKGWIKKGGIQKIKNFFCSRYSANEQLSNPNGQPVKKKKNMYVLYI